MTFSSRPLISWTSKGLFCEAGGFYIDPIRSVDRAIITHAHSDHARRGHSLYICEETGVELLKTRLGKKITVQTKRYGEAFRLGDVTVSLHSAGHILGSAQVRVQRGQEVWVASGDYKRDRDPSCAPFEVVACDTFITEATFGTPKFTWQKNVNHGDLISDWWTDNRARRRNCLLFGYSLGKAQRILAELEPYAERPILIHSTMTELTECYRRQGLRLARTIELQQRIKELSAGELLEGELILAPPSVLKEAWAHHLGNYQTAFASGWMQGRPGRYDRGFVMSDHADWDDLNQTIEESGARRVYVQHREGALIRHLKRKGLDAHPVEMLGEEHYLQNRGGQLSFL